MAVYSYTKRSVHSSWLVTITLKEVFTLFMAGYNYTKISVCSFHGWLQLHLKKCLLSSWLVAITLKEVSTLCMTGYNYTKEVFTLHGWLQLH